MSDQKSLITQILNVLSVPKACYVFIDNENLRYSLLKLGWRLDLCSFLRYIKRFTNRDLIKSFFYVRDDKNIKPEAGGYFDIIRGLGGKIIFVPVEEKFRNGEKGFQCNADSAIMTDMMDYQYEFDTIVLVSGDKDYRYTLERLVSLPKAKKVYVISSKISIAAKLRYNKKFTFLPLESMRNEVELFLP